MRTWSTTKTRHGFMTETPLETIIPGHSRNEVASEEVIKGQSQGFVTSSVEDVNQQQQQQQQTRPEDKTCLP